MAAIGSSFTSHLRGPRAAAGLSNPGRAAGAPFVARISATGNGATACSANELSLAEGQGPSCIFVGPVETASQETLEALYSQARDSYYSGKPLIVDDMFDRVELRWYGSKAVVKYPRCSLWRQSTFADAEEDLSQAFTLASIWLLFLVVGGAVFLVPIIYTVGLAFQDELNSGFAISSQVAHRLTMANGFLLMAMGSLISYPIFSASVKVLQGQWRNDLVALKGACPNCGEEVFAFVKWDQSNAFPHKADCHVCECALEFRTKAEKSISKFGRRWVYVRIYLVSRRGRGPKQRWI